MIPYQLTILSSGRNVLLIIGIIVVIYSASILTMSLSTMNSKYALFKAYVLASKSGRITLQIWHIWNEKVQ